MPEYKILVVEDEEGIALHIQFNLKKLGYTPLGPVVYGKRAVAQAAELRPDLVLMDINLLDGQTGIIAAREINTQLDIPVIFLSGVSDEEVLRSMRDSNPYAYLVKPVQPRELRAAIELAMYKHQMERRLRESEARYRGLFETMTSGFVLFDSLTNETGQVIDFRMVDINPAMLHLMNASREGIQGRRLSEIHSAPDLSFYINLYEQTIASTEPVSREVYEPVYARYLEMRAYSPGSGQMALVVNDVTGRHHVEQELRQSYRQTAQALLRMTVLRSIDTAITTYTDLPTISQAILEIILSLDEVDAALMFYPDQAELSLVGVSGISENALTPLLTNSLTREATYVFINRQPSTHGSKNDAGLRDSLPALADNLASQLGFEAFAFMPLVTKGQVKGVLLLLAHVTAASDEVGVFDFFHALALQAAIAIDNVELFQGLKRSNEELSCAYDETIRGWAEALELRSADTRGHCDRVVQLSDQLARAMGMPEEDLIHFRRGVMLHDIGKLGIPDSILLKNGSLNEEEWEAIRRHPMYGYQMLRNIEYLRPAIDVPYCHHERWDGTGYPHGLAGDAIPRAARIFAVVDAWDALVSERPYHPPWPAQDAAEYLIAQSGKQFDPEVVDVFLALMNESQCLCSIAAQML